MEKINIKNTDLFVSRLCFGGCPMGGHGWGDVSRKKLIDAVRRAVEIGINFFDTADVYGLGEAEKLLGEALGENRQHVVIASKVGVRVENGKTWYDNSPSWIRKSIEGSLNRLQTDYIDIYQIHYRDSITPIQTVIECLEELKNEGKIKYYGLSNLTGNDIDELSEFKSNFVSFQNEFSLANRMNEVDILKLSKQLDMTSMTWGSLGQGVLSGKYDHNSVFESNDRRSRKEYVNFHGEKLTKNLIIVNALQKISKEINKPVSSIAIRWILDFLPESVVIAGIKDVYQLESNFTALNWKLSKEHMKILEEISRCEYE